MPQLVSNKFQPEQASPVQQYIEKQSIVPVNYKTAIVDNKIDRPDTLIQYLDGSYAKVVYFRQVLNRDDSPTQYSLDLSAPVQQYDRIDGYELIMQGSLNTQYETSENRLTTITGEAFVRQPLIPNVGDVFLMDFGRGTLGWFGVNTVQRMTHRKNTVYNIEFSLSFEIHDQYNDKRMLDLNKKTIAVYQYSSDYLHAGQNPLITPKKAETFKSLLDDYKRFQKLWFRKFYHRFHETCYLPNQVTLVYDGFYMKAIRHWFSVKEIPEMTYFKVLDDTQFGIYKNPSIWDAITQQDVFLLREVFKKAVATKVEAFRNQHQFSSIRYSGFGALITPAEMTYSNDVYIDKSDVIGKPIGLITSVNASEMYTYKDMPLIHQVNLMSSYVFSPEFYKNEVHGLSHLEVQLRKYLENTTLDVDVIDALRNDVVDWSELELYYYLPTLMILMNYCVRRM